MRRVASWLLPIAEGGRALAPLPATVIERWYSDALYPRLQHAATRATNTVPFAVLDVLLALALAGSGWAIVRAARGRGSVGTRLGRAAWRVAVAASAVYLVFLVAWGLNYRRAPAAERFGLDRALVTEPRLHQLSARAVREINGLYDGRDLARLEGAALVREMEAPFARAVREAGARLPVVPGRPKWSVVGMTFPLTGVDGMINPFGLEVIVNPEVLPFERPFVVAHEWGHLAGHAAESEASFVAWLACLHGPVEAQYSGWLSLWLHVARSLSPEGRRAALEALGPGPRRDLAALRQRLLRAHPGLQAASWRVYDRYLRANRVESGVRSYDEVVTLVLGSPLVAPLLD